MKVTYSKLDARVPTEVMNGRCLINISRFIGALYASYATLASVCTALTALESSTSGARVY
jgi:hypothetical protein